MEPVFISEVMGEGAEAHRLVRVGSWEMRAQGAAGTEPTVRDLDAAERLGFKRPRDVRKLIERIWPQDKRPIHRATVARRNVRGGGVQEYTVDEYWLTEAQLLKVIARSKTDIAEAILDEMIAVYMAARRGLLVPAGHLPPEQAEDLRRELAEVRASSIAGIIGEDRAVEVTHMLRALAHLRARARGTKERSERRRAENELRNAFDFNGVGTDWPALPRGVLHKVQRVLRRWVKDAHRECRRSGRNAPVVVLRVAVQLSIPFGGAA